MEVKVHTCIKILFTGACLKKIQYFRALGRGGEEEMVEEIK